MASYVYKGLDGDGATVTGRLSAADEGDALKQLEAQAISAFEIAPESDATKKFARRTARPKDRHRYIRQLAVLLRAGTPLLSAFENLSDEEPCRELYEATTAIRRSLRSGATLSQAMAQHLPGLPNYAPRLIELGETTGNVGQAISDIARQMDHDIKSANEVRNALAYPAFLACMGTVAVFFMFLFVVPRFASLLGGDTSGLPAFSRWVISTGVFLESNLVMTLLVAFGILAFGIAAFRNARVRRAVVEGLNEVPIVKQFFKASETARWARTFATALAGGAPMLEALSLAESAVDLRRRKQGLKEARRAIRSGEAIDSALSQHTDFDAMTINLIRTGRASASLEEMLSFLADIYEEEARNRAKRVTALAEPLAVLFIASVVGLIVVSLVMAMTSLYDVAL